MERDKKGFFKATIKCHLLLHDIRGGFGDKVCYTCSHAGGL